MSSSSRWNILYRGPLSSCNYACSYCPFAKTSNTAAELRDDAQKLGRFVSWVAAQTDREIGILFTPWGEAAIHPYYQEAIIKLSHLANVYRVAIQTNLSGKLTWLRQCDLQTAALWATYHPSQTSLDSFLGQTKILDEIGARYSVGAVGFNDELQSINNLRARLDPKVYLWINAYKDVADYYQPGEIEAFEKIDPHFRTNTINHASMGKPCNAGHTSFSVDGDGNTWRCHFIKKSIGNIYQSDFRKSLTPQPAPCTNETCDCHIGYIHLADLKLNKIYQDGLLNRIPDKY